MPENPNEPNNSERTINCDRVRAQMRVWQDRVLDLTKSNHLLAINRSRVSKLRVTYPHSHQLFTRVAVEEAPIKLPHVRRHAGRDASRAESSLFDQERELEF